MKELLATSGHSMQQRQSEKVVRGKTTVYETTQVMTKYNGRVTWGKKLSPPWGKKHLIDFRKSKLDRKACVVIV